MRKAYVTMMCGGDGYLRGVQALGRSLAETGTEVPRVVMLTPDVSQGARAQLETEGWQLHDIEPVPCPNKNELLFARFAMSFTKLRVFEMLAFDKLVFLDADTIVLTNIDELFERPSFAAAPDFFMPDRFNSGVMVLDPSKQLYAELIDSLGKLPAYDGGDQGVLNAHFSDWWAMPVGHRLPAGYNFHHFIFEFMNVHQGLKSAFLHEVKIVHYTVQKPWQSFTLTGGAKLWWEKFYLAHPEASSKWKERLHALQDGLFDRFVGLID